MTQLHIVVGTMGGYAREDASVAHVVGAYINKDVAQKVALASSSKVVTVELNTIPQCYLDIMQAFQMNVDDILAKLKESELA